MSKRKGSERESELVNNFQDAGWFARRAGGSGAGKNESYDIIAAKPGTVYVLEVKYNGDGGPDYMYVDTQEVKELCYVAWHFDAIPLLVGRWARDTTFYGFHPNNCPRTGPNDDGNYKLDKSMRPEGIPLPPDTVNKDVDYTCGTCGLSTDSFVEAVYHRQAVDCS